MNKVWIFVFFVVIGFSQFQGLKAQTDSTSLFDMSLEDLMNIQVTSVSKKAEKLQNVPSSIYVITSRDIEKSGATTLMELLRESVPGYWASTIDYKRNDSYIRNTNTGSLLVLLDGTPMQDLMFSSFYYNNFEIPLEEIERIEVIKGSGGVVYGANSASGVISIFTKGVNDNKKLNVNVQVASPFYTNANVRGLSKFSDNFSLKTYGQFTYFKGFKQLDAIEQTNPTVPSSFTGGDTAIVNRFTGDDKTFNSLAFGISPQIKVNDKLTISSNIHINAMFGDKYFQDFPIAGSDVYVSPVYGVAPTVKDTVFLAKDDKLRLTGNIKFDYKLSETNSLFARISTNYEEQWYAVSGGYHTNNSIIDFEVQDNIELPYNTISVGANYRLVKFDINKIYNPDIINYVDPQNTESLKGFFLQDKISFLENKLNVYLGIKAENFSLINDKFYWSPMAKVVINPVPELTLWGGYSKSFTTPGYNQTNIQFSFFSIRSDKFFSTVVPASIYFETYGTLINSGADPATADAQARAFLESPDGQALIATNIAGGMAQYPNTYRFAAINGPETVPTSITNLEAGVRYQPTDKIYVETNIYYNIIKDGVINSPIPFEGQPSLITPGEYINAYYYGNYLKGTSYGLETVLKYLPHKGLAFELSHSLYAYNSEFQENSDFDISTLTEVQKDLVDEKYPTVPQNIFRLKVSVDLPMETYLTVSGLYATAYYNRFGTVAAFYEYDMQRFDPLFSDKGYIKYGIGENDSRTVINFKLSKNFLNQKMKVFVFGNDIFQSSFVESVNQLTTVYPRQTGRMLGFGVNYSL